MGAGEQRRAMRGRMLVGLHWGGLGKAREVERRGKREKSEKKIGMALIFPGGSHEGFGWEMEGDEEV